ncbi:MAG: ISNCY family transposase [Lachnospiraceae bacterium]|nr:ISNCY family transposase [Lachnospiraceae bacterium]
MDELHKYEVIKKVVESNGNKNTAAVNLGVTRRQVDRLIVKYKEQGKAAFIHGNKGRKPAIAKEDSLKKDIVDLYRTKYSEANFTHFTELLERNEGIKVSVTFVSSVLEANGILSPRVTRAKKKRIKKQLEKEKAAAKTKKEADKIQENIVALEDAHSRRPRCAYFGELEQMDASPYAWFGDSKTTLHIAVDDATGAITGGCFDAQETLNGYYRVFEKILRRYGIPYKFFTDRRTVFTYKKKKDADIGEDTCTQFAYACKQLGTQIEYSSVPQAKGRVERMFETLQSRLPIELKLAGVTDIAGANEFLDHYIDEFNAKFALPINNSKSVFEAQPTDEQINLILSVLTQRVVDSGHCIQFEKRYYRMLDSKGVQVHYRKGTKTMVIRALDGSLYCSVNDKDIYALEEIPKQAEKSKDFDTDYIDPKPRKCYIPAMNHPWRSKAFWKFVKAQEHHFMDDVSA